MTVADNPPTEIQALIDKHINAFNTQNVELFLSVFGDDAIIIDGIAPYRSAHRPQDERVDVDVSVTDGASDHVFGQRDCVACIAVEDHAVAARGIAPEHERSPAGFVQRRANQPVGASLAWPHVAQWSERLACQYQPVIAKDWFEVF